MSLFTGAALLASGLAASGSAAFAAHKTSSSADKAAQLQAAGANAALKYTKEKEAQDRADAHAAELANYQQWVQRENRMAPYRAAGQAASQTMGSLLGLPAVDIPAPAAPPAYLNPTPTAAATRATPSANGYVGTLADLM